MHASHDQHKFSPTSPARISFKNQTSSTEINFDCDCLFLKRTGLHCSHLLSISLEIDRTQYPEMKKFLDGIGNEAFLEFVLQKIPYSRWKSPSAVGEDPDHYILRSQSIHSINRSSKVIENALNESTEESFPNSFYLSGGRRA